MDVCKFVLSLWGGGGGGGGREGAVTRVKVLIHFLGSAF